jgi:transcriptional regulator with XRE-family HTH domain
MEMTRLKRLIKESKLRVYDVERLTGINYTTICFLEHNKRELNLKYASKLAPVLGVSVNYLMGKEDDPLKLLEININNIKQDYKKILTKQNATPTKKLYEEILIFYDNYKKQQTPQV